ncbi:DUF445 domain-containing protein [Bacillus cereus group sp. BfR-BA-01380]|uniref:DUF445 domain-containing protein n=1 Tax=Bacillus cereus group sp. BfR-BA-01380 TaxID=2920324 RepID=UPI001F58463C|nr:DUF445 family protein [Bacillus cereus group sp. BfR-BA-01380]
MWLNLLTTTGIGAVIGGYTNHLAIKMLFRPHHPKYIGKFRVPFTPGLIPKRRDELAVQLGKMVVDHLLTPEGIEKKLTNESFQQELIDWAQTAADKLLMNEQTLHEMLEQLDMTHMEDRVTKQMEGIIIHKVDLLFETYRAYTWEQALPFSVHEKIDEKMPDAAAFMIQKAVDFFESPEGTQRLSKMVDEFFASRGTLLNLVGMFLGNVSVVDKLQPEVIKFLQQEGTKQLLSDVMRKEWEKLKQREVSEVESFISKEDALKGILSFVKVEQAVGTLFNQSVRDVCAPIRDNVRNNVIPSAVRNGLQWATNHIGDIMQRLHLADIVQQEVESFPIERIEELVLSITKSELKMITYLGALLGGLIGIVQGLLLIVMS